MKVILQRVASANVKVDGKTVGSINKGYLVFVGVTDSDTALNADKMADKLYKLRIFADSDGKTNLSINDVDGELLIVSQFTLYADCKKGNRPSFINAGSPDKAKELYEYFISACESKFKKVAKGVFGADMAVELVNDGPFTLILEY